MQESRNIIIYIQNTAHTVTEQVCVCGYKVIYIQEKLPLDAEMTGDVKGKE